MNRLDASDLKDRADCLKPEKVRDPDGNVIQSYVSQFLLAARVHSLRGGESVMAARMQSKAPAIITVRASSLSRQITSEWRVKIRGIEFDVKEDPRLTADRRFMEFLAEA